MPLELFVALVAEAVVGFRVRVDRPLRPVDRRTVELVREHQLAGRGVGGPERYDEQTEYDQSGK
jgi:hypothetical protein